jgi:hypothetical protein
MDREAQIKRFLTVKSYVNLCLGGRYAHFCKRELTKNLSRLNNTAEVLTNLLIKEYESHNSKIRSAQKKLSKLPYKDHNTYDSSVFKIHKIPYDLIDQHLKNHPDYDFYHIAQTLYSKLHNK